MTQSDDDEMTQSDDGEIRNALKFSHFVDALTKRKDEENIYEEAATGLAAVVPLVSVVSC